MSSPFWSELTRTLQPYTPGEQPQLDNLLKLNTNESPYPPAPGVMAAISGVTGDEVLRYPDPSSRALREAIGKYHQLSADRVFVGNGSDEVLSHVFAGLLKHDRELLFPDITYSFYPVWCRLHDISYREIPLSEDFSVDPSDYDSNAAAVILPNPNAPTGRLLPLEQIARFCSDAPDRLMVVDEAYVDFGGQSAVALLPEYNNLLIVQTLSKSRALAGLRVGLAIGSAPLIEGLERVKDSFNSYPLGVVAQRAAVAAYADEQWFDECRERVMGSRDKLAQELHELGFEVLPSSANFLFMKHRERPGSSIFEALRGQGIIVRRWDKPRIEDYLRISIGTEEQCARLLHALTEILA